MNEMKYKVGDIIRGGSEYAIITAAHLALGYGIRYLKKVNSYVIIGTEYQANSHIETMCSKVEGDEEALVKLLYGP